MEASLQIKDTDDLPAAARRLKSWITDEENGGLSPYRLVLFYGGLGAGKTTVIKELCSQLGVVDTVTSPTFALVNEYNTELGEAVYHFDFYRIESLEEVYDLGYEEYFYSGSLCLIEWPEKVEPLLPGEGDGLRVARVDIRVGEDGERELTIRG